MKKQEKDLRSSVIGSISYNLGVLSELLRDVSDGESPSDELLIDLSNVNEKLLEKSRQLMKEGGKE